MWTALFVAALVAIAVAVVLTLRPDALTEARRYLKFDTSPDHTDP